MLKQTLITFFFNFFIKYNAAEENFNYLLFMKLKIQIAYQL